MPTRPKSLTFIAVVAVVLGVSTALTSLANVLAVKTASLGSSSLAPPGAASAANAELVAARVELQRRMVEINGRHRGLFLAVMPFALIASAGMIVGGVKAYSLRRWSRPVLMAALAVSLVVEIICAKPQLETQLEMADATSTMMTTMVKSMDTTAGGSHAAQSMVAATETMTRITATAGVAMRVALSLSELAFLIFALIYLSRERTRELFAGQ